MRLICRAKGTRAKSERGSGDDMPLPSERSVTAHHPSLGSLESLERAGALLSRQACRRRSPARERGVSQQSHPTRSHPPQPKCPLPRPKESSSGRSRVPASDSSPCGGEADTVGRKPDRTARPQAQRGCDPSEATDLPMSQPLCARTCREAATRVKRRISRCRSLSARGRAVRSGWRGPISSVLT